MGWMIREDQLDPEQREFIDVEISYDQELCKQADPYTEKNRPSTP